MLWQKTVVGQFAAVQRLVAGTGAAGFGQESERERIVRADHFRHQPLLLSGEPASNLFASGGVLDGVGEPLQENPVEIEFAVPLETPGKSRKADTHGGIKRDRCLVRTPTAAPIPKALSPTRKATVNLLRTLLILPEPGTGRFFVPRPKVDIRNRRDRDISHRPRRTIIVSTGFPAIR